MGTAHAKAEAKGAQCPYPKREPKLNLPVRNGEVP